MAYTLGHAGQNGPKLGWRLVTIERNGLPDGERDRRAQAAQRLRAVFVLGTPFVGLGDDTGWQVRQAHGALRLVAVLAAGAGGAKSLDTALGEQRLVRQRQGVGDGVGQGIGPW